MKKAAIVGLGNRYHEYVDRINEQYDIVGYFDNDITKHNERIKAVSEIEGYTYDLVIVTPDDDVALWKELLALKVEKEKIKPLYEIFNIYGKKTTIGITCYGQHYDDLIIAGIFGQIGVERPTYIDLGANHPVKFSNTYLFYLSGSRGINVDANPDILQAIIRMKPDDINLNVGVASKRGTMPFYICGNVSGLNTFSKEEAESNFKNQEYRTIDVPVVLLKDIIDDYFNGKAPDFLDCDIEGLDYEVLQSYDMKEEGPRIVCVEVRQREIDKFDELMTLQEYYRFCRLGENNIYVRNEFKNILSHM